MLHLLPCLTTVNFVGYINGRELNNWCGVLSICNSLHIELHWICSIVCCILPCHASFKPDKHHTWLCIMPCLWLCVYRDVCFFSVALLLDSSAYVAVVRIRSSTSVCLLHGLVLLPSGISGKMTIPSKSLLSLLASCSLYRFVALPTTCLSCLPFCHVKPLTHLS
mgnify:CR=1 FL=1